MNQLAAQLLESPKAPQIIQQVQAILADEQNRRRAFYEWLDEEVELTRNSYEPDVCYFGLAKATTIQPELLYYPAPDLVVEALPKSTKKRPRGKI